MCVKFVWRPTAQKTIQTYRLKHIDCVYGHRFPHKEGTKVESGRLNKFGDPHLQGLPDQNMAQSLIKP